MNLKVVVNKSLRLLCALDMQHHIGSPWKDTYPRMDVYYYINNGNNLNFCVYIYYDVKCTSKCIK